MEMNFNLDNEDYTGDEGLQNDKANIQKRLTQLILLVFSTFVYGAMGLFVLKLFMPILLKSEDLLLKAFVSNFVIIGIYLVSSAIYMILTAIHILFYALIGKDYDVYGRGSFVSKVIDIFSIDIGKLLNINLAGVCAMMFIGSINAMIAKDFSDCITEFIIAALTGGSAFLLIRSAIKDK